MKNCFLVLVLALSILAPSVRSTLLHAQDDVPSSDIVPASDAPPTTSDAPPALPADTGTVDTTTPATPPATAPSAPAAVEAPVASDAAGTPYSVQDAPPKKIPNEPTDMGRELSLKSTIEEGLRESPNEKINDYMRASLELKWKDAFDSFWYPNIALVMSTGDQNVDRLKTMNNRGANQISTTRAPYGYVGLQLGEYTVFNWGKDYLNYLNEKYRIERAKENIQVARRQTKFQIIDQYFNLGRVKAASKTKREELRRASFIYRLARERAAQQKITKQDYFSARAEYLRAQDEYYRFSSSVANEEGRMADLIGDKNRYSYRLSETLKYSPLKITLTEAIDSARVRNPTLLTTKQEYENADRRYEIAKKDNLPLPKFSVNLGTYKQNLGNNNNELNYETHPGNSNVEVVASVNLTWNLLGEGGLFNQRRNQQALIDKKISEIRLRNADRGARIRIQTLFEEIRQLEREVNVTELHVQNARKNMDVTQDNYLAGKARFIDFKSQLATLSQAELAYESAKYTHLSKKLELADLMGIEDFPGENFELLAKKEISE